MVSFNDPADSVQVEDPTRSPIGTASEEVQVEVPAEPPKETVTVQRWRTGSIVKRENDDGTLSYGVVVNSDRFGDRDYAYTVGWLVVDGVQVSTENLEVVE